LALHEPPINLNEHIVKIKCSHSILLIFFLTACSEHIVESRLSETAPVFLNITVEKNGENALSAVVSARLENAVKAYLKFGADTLLAQISPRFPVINNEVKIPLLGLMEKKTYAVRVVAVSPAGQETESDFMYYTSGEIPQDIPGLAVVHRQNPSAGYLMLGFASPDVTSKGYAVIINNRGQVVWYRVFDSPVVDFQKQPNGFYTAYTVLNSPSRHFYEMDNLGNILREFAAREGYSTGPHEIRLVEGGYCLFAVEIREMDLTAMGGLPNALVRGTGIEFISSTRGNFYWSPFDKFLVTDAAPDIPLNTVNVNPWHGNAIEIDSDGNLLVSFRNSDEIAKIDTQTGEVIWRFGGKNNEFTILNDPLNGFSHQHGIRRLKNGNVILFDNGNLHVPPASRAVEYKLNEQAKIAEMAWEYRHEPPLYGFALGFAHRAENGNTIINYGTANRIIEVDPAGTKQLEIAVTDSVRLVYRAFRIESIY
jgi:hypothetical protein